MDRIAMAAFICVGMLTVSVQAGEPKGDKSAATTDKEGPSAAAAETVAILDLKAQGADEVLVRNLTDLLIAEAGRVPNFKVLGRSEVKEMVGFEIEKQALGCDDPACMTELSNALGTTLMVTGSIGRVGKTYTVTLRLIDLKKVEGRNRIGETLPGRVELLPNYIRVATWRLFDSQPPQEVAAAYEETKTRLEKEEANKKGGEETRAETERAKAAAELARAEAEKARAEADKIRANRDPSVVKRKESRTWQGTIAKVGSGIAALGLLGGGAMHAYSWIKGKDADPGSEDEETSDTYKSRAITAYIVGGVGAVVAIVFEILDPGGEEDEVAWGIRPTPTGIAVSF